MASQTMAEKIAALLSKTVERGATEAEALAAAQKAQELMAKYHIEMIDLGTGSESEDVDITNATATRRWERCLFNAVAKNMRCRVLFETVNRKALLEIIGFETDRAAVLETCKMLLNVCRAGIKRAKATARKRSGMTSGVEDAYAFSFIRAVQDEMGKSSMALMLVVPKEVNDFIDEHYSKIKHTTIRPRGGYDATSIRDAKDAGYSDGRSAMGRQQLTAGNAQGGLF